nr:MAG TPA: hypothetical protein [Caudoviricetes sp.]DAV78728.1 MAG TPA: hypothetical protein [Caudoviricetes sp.]
MRVQRNSCISLPSFFVLTDPAALTDHHDLKGAAHENHLQIRR